MKPLYDASSNSGLVTLNTSASWSHTCSGFMRALFVLGGTRDGTPVLMSSITYAGIRMAKVWDFINASEHCCGFMMLNPPLGSNTIVATTVSSQAELYFGAHSLRFVNQETPYRNSAGVAVPLGRAGGVTASGADNLPSVTAVGVANDDMVLDGGVGAVSETGASPGAGQTERWEIVNGGSFGSSQLGADGGVMSWTIEFNGWAMGALAVLGWVPPALVRPRRTRYAW